MAPKAAKSAVVADLPFASEALDFSIAPIAVDVGTSSPKRFYANEVMLRTSSKFFDAALNKEWKEGQERTVSLPDCQPAVFNVYLNWLTTGKLCVNDQLGTAAGKRDIYTKLTDAYILGDQMMAIGYRDAVSDAVFQECLTLRDGQYWAPGVGPRRQIYENTVAGSSGRRLIVAIMVTFPEVHTTVKENEPSALLHDMMAALGTNKPRTYKQLEEDVKACKFHDHEPGVENCYRSKHRQMI